MKTIKYLCNECSFCQPYKMKDFKYFCNFNNKLNSGWLLNNKQSNWCPLKTQTWRKHMTIQQKVAYDLNKARVQQNKEALGVLQVILGEFQRIDKEVSDKQAIQKLKSLRKSAIEMMDKTNSLTAQTELEYYESYLPQIIPIVNVKDWISDNIDFSNLKNPMQAIGLVKKQFGTDCIDGEAVKNLITELTS